MNRRRLIPLVIGVVLLTIGAGLILYGSTLPADFVAISPYDYHQSEVNFLIIVGIFPACIGIFFLLLGFFTRSKTAIPTS